VSVIPAKAGIHLQEKAWIPAFAGMTEKEAETVEEEAGMTRETAGPPARHSRESGNPSSPGNSKQQ
jgi:hypothetical protein